ncbi:IclR family transcriptional regulator [Glutamicibacter sp.]|jgi:Transcriptional regulator|uniref:IclR family transcriptional regulator n=1 Tax=Glutamicibacter sp. TaxID=1931995 RepID=UPI002B462468|nr:IclR family transcriptional regulator [Glutamicibacter sp.]HJX76776.1 IclR family transcriptional regulator [Glutamicibacter sp.]
MENKSSPVESVDRALLLLMRMRDQGPLSVKAAAEQLDVAPSTAHRLLSALTFRGFAAQDHDRQYRLGPALSDRSAEAFSTQLIRKHAHESLVELQETVGETVQLMVLRGGNIQFIDGIESKRTLRVGMRVGDKMPAFVSAGGKAMLARLTNTELEDLYRSGLPNWATGRITNMATLKRGMTRIRREGFGTNFEETEQGVIGMGVSINDAAGRPVAAITTATPSIRFERADMPAHLTALHRAAEGIATRLFNAAS